MKTEQPESNSRRDMLLGAIIPSVAAAALLGGSRSAHAQFSSQPTITSETYITGKDFGAVGNGTADDTVALQEAIDYCFDNKRSLYLKSGTYKVSATLLKDQAFHSINIIGDGSGSTIIKGTHNGPILKIKGGSGSAALSKISHISFEGSNIGVAVEVADQCNLVFEHCQFTKCTVGLQLHNEHGFTEFVRALGCDFTSSCILPLELRRTGGDASFHGCGIVGKSVIDSPAFPSSVVRIGAGCFLYNSEFNMQVFTHHASTIFENLSTEGSYAFGFISVEPQTTQPLLVASGRHLPFAGVVTGIGSDVVKLGSLYLCESVYVGQTGGLSFTGGRYANKINNAAKTNVLPSPLASCVRQVHVNINANNYVYRALLVVEHNGFGSAGTYSISHSGMFFNSAGYGAPSFSVDSSGRLVITNNNFPTTGVIINYQETQLTQPINGNFVGA